MELHFSFEGITFATEGITCTYDRMIELHLTLKGLHFATDMNTFGHRCEYILPQIGIPFATERITFCHI